MKLYVGGKKVLVLGSGFGGTYVLRRLVPSLDRNENIETTMVSDENFFLFTPFLPEVAMGRIESRHTQMRPYQTCLPNAGRETSASARVRPVWPPG